MERQGKPGSPSRRQFLQMVGLTAGTGWMYQAMSGLDAVRASTWSGRPQWSGGEKNVSVLVLGAGLAGLTAAFELQQAGYRVTVLEYDTRVGGRNLTLRRGDVVREIDGLQQACEFDTGLHFNAGPWRVPYHHHAILDYCRRFALPLEPFVQANYNTLLSNRQAGHGSQRFRTAHADYYGGICELLSKAAESGRLDDMIGPHDLEPLLESLQICGGLNAQGRYAKGKLSSDRRGYDIWPGAGTQPPVFSTPPALSSVLDAQWWRYLGTGERVDYQPAMMQIAGGMDRLAAAFIERLSEGTLRLATQVTRIEQDTHGVNVHWRDTVSGQQGLTQAQWCVCTLPLPILKQLPVNVDASMRAAIAAVDYASSVKIGMQFKRRFWEEDERIYGGVTYSDSPYGNIGYPSDGFGTAKGVLLGSYTTRQQADQVGAVPPAQRIRMALQYGAQVHPQMPEEFEHGISVAWHRMPGAQGCWASWTDELRARHYASLAEFSGRLVLAGEHVSYLAGWQEGAILSALDAAERLHRRAMSIGS